jgi:Zn-dependent protease with chaperone function
MGYFLLLLMVLLDGLGVFLSYCVGTYIVASLANGGMLFHFVGDHLGILERLVDAFIHMPPWWHQWIIHTSATLQHTDGRGWGYMWVGLNLFWHAATSIRVVKKQIKLRRGLGVPHPGDKEWEVVERCYERFRQAAARQVPPVKFKTPRTFRYEVGPRWSDVEFIGWRLVIGDKLLTTGNRHLAPLLAHQLAYYNSGDLFFRLILDCCPEIWFIRLAIFGLPIAVPTIIRDYVWPIVYWKKRVFAADEFACMLGQCNALIRTLEARQHFQRRRGPFRTEPYIQERLNRLRRWQANHRP